MPDPRPSEGGPLLLWRPEPRRAEEVGGWTPGHTDSKMHAIFRTAREHQAGKRVEWDGLAVSPRYKFRNETIIEWLEITPEEERRLKTIISDEERRRRDRERDERRRREAGAMTRDQYEGRAAWRRSEAPRLRSEGLSVRQIAADLGIKERRVKQLLKEHREEGVQSPSG